MMQSLMLDAGKGTEAIKLFFDISDATLGRIQKMRKAIAESNHAYMNYLVNDKQHGGEDMKSAVMEHYGYKIPDSFISAVLDEADFTQDNSNTVKAVDYSAFLTAIMSQLSQFNSIQKSMNDAGAVVCELYQQVVKVTKQLESIQTQICENSSNVAKKQESIIANQNAIIHRIDNMQENVNSLTRTMKNKQ